MPILDRTLIVVPMAVIDMACHANGTPAADRQTALIAVQPPCLPVGCIHVTGPAAANVVRSPATIAHGRQSPAAVRAMPYPLAQFWNQEAANHAARNAADPCAAINQGDLR